MLTILGFLAGTALAARFNVLILLPGTITAWLLVLVSGVANAHSGTWIAVEMALVVIGLQLGYLAGIVLQGTLLASRRRSRSGRSTMVPDGTY
jgi:hypothetical protein